MANEPETPLWLILCVFFLVIGTLIGRSTNEHLYKDGQIDCLTGQIKYELIENQDKTKSWEVMSE